MTACVLNVIFGGWWGVKGVESNLKKIEMKREPKYSSISLLLQTPRHVSILSPMLPRVSFALMPLSLYQQLLCYLKDT